MIQLTPQMRILVAVEPVDFRKGIDGLTKICRQRIKSDPFSGCVFVFCNKKKTAIKKCFHRLYWFLGHSFFYECKTPGQHGEIQGIHLARW
ncbi:IS66 family insertion sequence element accessory protein TnpB [Desulfonatronospira thiodismutans]|uniref:IS66 family insertion sequence element accessory protein TnpB n=1 Tax=Desulfonatronospira thiodismutans TaxID=488939 RepID=UPI000A04B8DE